MAVSLLTMWVQAPDEDDWGKGYLKRTIFADQLRFAVNWCVNGSHQIHKDFSDQTRSLVTFGQGAVVSLSNKMKCITKEPQKLS